MEAKVLPTRNGGQKELCAWETHRAPLSFNFSFKNFKVKANNVFKSICGDTKFLGENTLKSDSFLLVTPFNLQTKPREKALNLLLP